MIECCERAVSFVHGLDFAGFVTDSKTRSAVQRELFVLGEAAKQIPVEVRDLEPAIDWRGIAGLRDILAHQYFRIDDAIVWDVVINEMPGLVGRLRAFAATLP